MSGTVYIYGEKYDNVDNVQLNDGMGNYEIVTLRGPHGLCKYLKEPIDEIRIVGDITITR